MEPIALSLFALALNMDAFAAGVAYGIRQIKLPLISVLIISLMSATTITLSMLFGNLIAGAILKTFAHYLGGIILVLIGILFVFQGLRKKENNTYETIKETKTIFQIHIQSLGLIIHVLREPHCADLDKSGMISSGEAFLLGTALAMDSLGAGFAVSMLGFDIMLTAFTIGTGHIALTYLGLFVGRYFGTTWVGHRLSLLPGCILILLGLSKLW